MSETWRIKLAAAVEGEGFGGQKTVLAMQCHCWLFPRNGAAAILNVSFCCKEAANLAVPFPMVQVA